MTLAGWNFAQSILLLSGVGKSGKGTIVNIITAIIGEENTTELRTSFLHNNRFETSRFVSKTLLVGPDTEGDFLAKAGAQRLKMLTGGDPMDAEYKGANKATRIRGDFNVVIVSNRRLRVCLDGDYEAWQRRIKIIVFDRQVQKPDPNISSRIIAEEGPGIINWMLEGLRLLREDFQLEGRWRLSPKQEQRIEDLLAESDSLRAYVREAVVEDREGSVTTEELFRGYLQYCEDRGWDAHSKRVFQTDMPPVIQDRFNLRIRHDIRRGAFQKRGYKGIRLTMELHSEERYVPNLE
jgi:putative DNA primase/helicase